ncbi:MBL fold metallo-hydrolase [Patescibacteria group bacterium]|nr:MBL fold metallo-hydrolase [Patescibacteria group bacterium]
MNRKARTLTLMALVTLGLGVSCLLSIPKKSDELAKVHMLNVGQGDSFLIEAKNGKQLLIDAGKDASVLSELARVMPRGDRSIDVVIATHPDADHIGGLPLVLSRYDVGLFLTSDVLTDTEQFKTLNDELLKRSIPSYYVRQGMNLSLDTDPLLPSKFSILFPDRSTTHWETNSASVVGRLDMGTASILLTGDAPSSVEQFLAKVNPREVDTDILKLGHHGSKTSTNAEFLKATSPSRALVSAGVSNRYGHPAKEVIDRLKEFGIPFVSTQDKGTVTLTTDGKTWK